VKDAKVGQRIYAPYDTKKMEETAQAGVEALRKMDEEKRTELFEKVPRHGDAIAETVSRLDQKLLARSGGDLLAMAESDVRKQIGSTKLGTLATSADRLGELIDAVRSDEGTPLHGKRIGKAIVDIAQAAGLTPAELTGVMLRLQVVAGLIDEKALRMAGPPIQKKVDLLSFAQELGELVYRPLHDALRA
jgi:hypothetical protein